MRWTRRRCRAIPWHFLIEAPCRFDGPPHPGGEEMSIFRGTRSIDGTQVTVDGRPLDPALDVHTYGHGFFEWSYEGDEPLQLSLAILKEHYGDPRKAMNLVQRFMEEIVANFDNEWEMTSEDISAALIELGGLSNCTHENCAFHSARNDASES